MLGIAVDVTPSWDTPEPPVKSAIELDKGPAIKVKDGGMLATPWVKDWMVDTAEANEIPYQLEGQLGIDIPLTPPVTYRTEGLIRLDSSGF